jgi:hypothetical protein
MTSYSNTLFANIEFIKNNCEGGKMVSKPKVPETRRGFSTFGSCGSCVPKRLEKYSSDITDWWSLELLVTDRNFRCRGAATRVFQWDTSQADKEGIVSGVDEANEMGAPLYKSLGFQKLTTWVVQVTGGSDTLRYAVMRREPYWEPRAA